MKSTKGIDLLIAGVIEAHKYNPYIYLDIYGEGLREYIGYLNNVISSHNACNIGANYFTAGNLFKAAKNSIIVEGTALYNNVFA